MIKLSIEEIRKYPYPNLMAEIVESHYSICTLGEHMELGKYLPEDSAEVWDRLTGKQDILASEALKLTLLFGADLKYLFSDELTIINGKPCAYWRWFEENQRREREHAEYIMRQRIEIELMKKPYLLELVSKIVSMSEEDARIAALLLTKKGGAV